MCYRLSEVVLTRRTVRLTQPGDEHDVGEGQITVHRGGLDAKAQRLQHPDPVRHAAAMQAAQAVAATECHRAVDPVAQLETQTCVGVPHADQEQAVGREGGTHPSQDVVLRSTIDIMHRVQHNHHIGPAKVHKAHVALFESDRPFDGEPRPCHVAARVINAADICDTRGGRPPLRPVARIIQSACRQQPGRKQSLAATQIQDMGVIREQPEPQQANEHRVPAQLPSGEVVSVTSGGPVGLAGLRNEPRT